MSTRNNPRTKAWMGRRVVVRATGSPGVVVSAVSSRDVRRAVKLLVRVDGIDAWTSAEHVRNDVPKPTAPKPGRGR